jgi:hypothetical protein
MTCQWLPAQNARKLQILTGFSESGYLIGLGAFGALDDIELDLVAFLETLIPLALDGAVMNEDICSIIAA